MKHTPGPWIALPSKIRWHGDRPIFDDGLWDILPSSDTEQIPICTVDAGNDHDPLTRARTEFDAMLIAAAPELGQSLRKLLPSLKNWLADLQTDTPDGWQGLADDIAFAEATLKKAGLL